MLFFSSKVQTSLFTAPNETVHNIVQCYFLQPSQQSSTHFLLANLQLMSLRSPQFLTQGVCVAQIRAAEQRAEGAVAAVLSCLQYLSWTHGQPVLKCFFFSDTGSIWLPTASVIAPSCASCLYEHVPLALAICPLKCVLRSFPYRMSPVFPKYCNFYTPQQTEPNERTGKLSNSLTI